MSTKSYLRILLFSFLALPTLAKAQNNKNIGIGTSNPDPAAILDISSTDKGVLIPRLTSGQITAISTPPEGLMVYNLDSACYFYYNNFQWVSLCHPGTASNGAHISIVNGRTDVQLGGPLIQNTDIPLAGYKLSFSTTNNGGNVGIGNKNPNPSAILDLSNTNNTGILIPKVALTDTNVAAPVTAPATGLMVFNTNTQTNVIPGYYYWKGSKWERIFSTNLPVVSTVTVTAPIVNTGTAQDPNIGITTSDLKSGGVISVTNGTNVLAGSTGADLDVVGTAGGVLYGSGASSAFTPAGTTGQYLRSQGAGSPAWTTGNDINGSTVVTVTNGTAQAVGNGNMSIDVAGQAGTVLYGTGASSAFTAQGTTGYLLQSNGTGAPSWVNPNAALVTSDIIGSSVLTVSNGTNKAINAGNVNLDVVGTSGGVMYGTGTSSAFTPAGTTGQVLRSTGAGAPVWASPNATLATNDVTGGSVVSITNGTGQVVGGANMNIDVAGTSGGVMYGTGSSSGFTSAGTAGQILTSNGTGAPTWQNLPPSLAASNGLHVSATPDVQLGGTLSSNTSINQAGFSLSASGGTINLNDASNNAVNIGTSTSTGTVSIGTGASTQTLSIGNGAGAKTVNLGSNNSTSTTNINSGSGAVNINDANNNPVNIATNSSTGTVNVGTGVSAQSLNMGTGAGVKTVSLGSTNSSSTTNINSGSGGVNINAANNQVTNINTGTSTGAVNIANGASAGTVQIGKGATITASNQKVGINNPGATEALDVTGNVRFSGALMPNNQPGTSGQYLKSQGAGVPPVWGTVSSRFHVPFQLGYTPTSTTNYYGLNTQAIGPFFTTTPAAANQYVVISDATYIAASTCSITKVYGWLFQQSWLAASTVTMYVYYYASPVSGNTYTTLVTGTLLNPGGTVVAMPNPSLGVYSYSIPLATTLNAGDVIVVYAQFNVVPILGSTTFRGSGFVEIQ